MSPRASTTAKLTVSALKLLLGNVKWATSKDPREVSLRCVNIEAAEGGLRATATDRYVLARQSVPAEVSEDGPQSITIDRREVTQLLKELPEPPRGSDPTVTLDWDRCLLTVTDWAGERARYPSFGAPFPNVSSVLPGEVSGPAQGELSQIILDPRRLAGFAKVKTATGSSGGIPMRLTFTGPHRPVGVRIGDCFVGVIMPIRELRRRS